MKHLFLMAALLVVGCASSTPSNPTNPVLTPIEAVGCDVETAVTSAFAATVATSLVCTNQTAIQASLQTALGNVNLCASQSVAAVSATQLKSAKDAKAVKPLGLVGGIVCPIAINTIIGYATAQIPAGWGCSSSASATTVSAALIAACTAAVPL